MNNFCIARGRCKSVGTEICTATCPFFMDIRYQIELASIPKKHQKSLASDLPSSYFSTDVFKRYCSNIVERVRTGQGLYLYSAQTGTGKSTTACSIAMEYIVEQLREDLRDGTRTTQLARFVNVPDFLDELRRGMDDAEAAKVAVDLTETLKRAPLIVLDDFGAEKISEWSRERLLTVISERYDNELATILTSNIGLQEVEVLLGKRIRSRIEGMTVPIEFKAVKDHRRKI